MTINYYGENGYSWSRPLSTWFDSMTFVRAQQADPVASTEHPAEWVQKGIELAKNLGAHPIGYKLHSQALIALRDHLKSAPIAEQPVVTDDMVDRFLSWKLPYDFYPDCGISFKQLGYPYGWPSGTNLFHAGQARAMLEYVLGVTKTS